MMLSHVVGPFWPSRSCFLALEVAADENSNSACFADFVTMPHLYGVGGLVGFGSVAVIEALSLDIAMAEHRGMFAVGLNSFMCDLVSRS